MIRPTRPAWYCSAVAAAMLLSGCAGVTVHDVAPKEYLAQRRGDVLTTGELSLSSQATLRVIGQPVKDCLEAIEACRQTLGDAEGLTDEQRLATIAELWLHSAIEFDEIGVVGVVGDVVGSSSASDRAINAWLETARYATAYLFYAGRSADMRAFEDRQTQVRDYYNYAVQKAVTAIFARTRKSGTGKVPDEIAGWTLLRDIDTLRNKIGTPNELLAASSLGFDGLRNVYDRDGIGAELVAVLPPPETKDERKSDQPPVPWVEMPFPVVSAALSFGGSDLAGVLATHEVTIIGRDPYRNDSIMLAGSKIPLAANFTAGYGLWLARSDFAQQSLNTLIGGSDSLVRPRVYLLQPYDPQRRIVVMMHGLASSPEAWINVANEVLGDEQLRQHYQIWQVYYPTNAPLMLNNYRIRQALQETLRHFDPDGRAPASHNVTLIGHSMGGMLARLMLLSSGDVIWKDVSSRFEFGPDQDKLREELEPLMHFEPLPWVSDAIFLAAPHRGSPVANRRLARWVANLIKLPLVMLQEFDDLGRQVAQLKPRTPGTAPLRVPNSIDNLSDRDNFIRAMAPLPIAPGVTYHSIIGNDTPDRPLAESDDGLVPYWSAHLDGAASELVIESGHSVQDQPEAIIEIRRILHEQIEQGR